MSVSRSTVVQGFLSLSADPTYLEVGVNQGATFHAVKAFRKVAVDPLFLFDVEAARSEHPECTYHEVPSDAYFGMIADPGERFDVIYLDGLHTFDQTLRDLNNSLHFLKPNGVIVIDDVYPSFYLASLPDQRVAQAAKARLGITDKSWKGDVYRLVYFIATFHQQLSYRTVSDNHGQLVLWQRRRDSVPDLRVEDTARMPYERIVLDRSLFCFEPYAEILDHVSSARMGNVGQAKPTETPSEVLDAQTQITALENRIAEEARQREIAERALTDVRSGLVETQALNRELAVDRDRQSQEIGDLARLVRDAEEKLSRALVEKQMMVRQTGRRAEKLTKELKDALDAQKAAERRYKAVLNSEFWRATGPLRRVADRLKGLRAS